MSAAAAPAREPTARRDPRAPQRAPASAPARAADPLAAPAPLFLPGLALQRCACGGGCPACRAKAAGLSALPIHPSDDVYEREADRVADAVMRGGSAPARTVAPALPAISRLQRCSCGGSHAGGGLCPECAKKQKEEMQRSAAGAGGAGVAPPIVHDVLRSPGQPLDPGVRAYFEPRFGRGFGDVRVHTDGRAAESARAVDAVAYTVGRNVVFGAGAYRPGSAEGRRLLAHELTHVVQQGAAPAGVQRTMVCSKPLEAPGIGLFARHAYVDDTGGNECQNPGSVGNYAVTDLVSGNFVRGCAAKTDRSPDPRGKTPFMKPCQPAPGVTDLSRCLRDAYNAYADPSLYSNAAVTVGAGVGLVGGAAAGAAAGSRLGPVGAVVGGVVGGLLGAGAGAAATSRINGPNSNTFAATLVRACCADTSSSGLGWVPGWEHAPAPPCPSPPPTPAGQTAIP